MGKSLYVKRMTTQLNEKLKSKPKPVNLCVTIPIHGPSVAIDEVIKHLLNNSEANPMDPLPQIFHFDVAPSVRRIYNTHIFAI